MRLLQVDIDGTRVELHPYVSIVRGLQPELRTRLVEAIAGLARGSTSGLRGLVEAHGVMLDLTPETLALLELGSGDAAIEPIVRSADLPFTALGPDAMARVELRRQQAALTEALEAAQEAAARAERLRAASEESLAELEGTAEEDSEGAKARDELRAIVAARSAERVRAEAVATEAATEDGRAAELHAAAVAAVAAARHRRVELSRACAVATTALEAARNARDPFASSALDVARQLLADVERELETGQTADDAKDAIDLDEIDAQISELEARRAPIGVALLALDSVDPFPVEVALAQVEAGGPDGVGPDPAAIALADQLEALDLEGGEGAIPEVDPGDLADARRRLDDARSALADAERQVRVPELDRDDVRVLEDAHAVVLDAQEKADGRFGGGRARQRLDEAREEEQVVLDRLGFLTYADFVMGTSILNVDAEDEARLEAARDELAAAEDAVAALSAGVDAHFADAERHARRRQLLDEATEILGSRPGEDAEWELRTYRVPLADEGERYERLRSALLAAGVEVDDADDPVPGSVAVELARVWLEERAETAATRVELEQELAEIERTIATRRQAREEVIGVATDPARRARAEARVDEARAALAAAEARVAQNDDAAGQIDELKAELERTTEEEAGAAAEVAAAELTEADAAARAHGCRSTRSKAQAELASALDAELAVVDELRELDERLRQASKHDSRAAREDAVATARLDAARAFAEVANLRTERTAVEARLADLPAPSEADEELVDPEEIEWYLLSRMAAQRNVSFAGSVPLVVDDAFAGLPEGAPVHLVERLERMANAVQVVIVTDDDDLASWAEVVGVDRAATLLPETVV